MSPVTSGRLPVYVRIGEGEEHLIGWVRLDNPPAVTAGLRDLLTLAGLAVEETVAAKQKEADVDG